MWARIATRRASLCQAAFGRPFFPRLTRHDSSDHHGAVCSERLRKPSSAPFTDFIDAIRFPRHNHCAFAEPRMLMTAPSSVAAPSELFTRDHDNGVLTLTLNTPRNLNALSLAMLEGLIAEFEAIAGD